MSSFQKNGLIEKVEEFLFEKYDHRKIVDDHEIIYYFNPKLVGLYLPLNHGYNAYSLIFEETNEYDEMYKDLLKEHLESELEDKDTLFLDLAIRPCKIDKNLEIKDTDEAEGIDVIIDENNNITVDKGCSRGGMGSSMMW